MKPDTPKNRSPISRFVSAGRSVFRLRIRDLLLLTAIAAILIGWAQDRSKLQRELELAKQLRQEAHWQTFQVAGPPNTNGYGDIVTAWASSTQDGNKEWLELEYDKTVKPKSIWIYETFNPGAVYKVSMFDIIGKEVVVWEGTDPLANTYQSGIAKIPLAKSFSTNRIKVYIDSPAVGGWNEIDAVGLVDQKGNKHWAATAKASSEYGSWQTAPTPSNPAPVFTQLNFSR